MTIFDILIRGLNSYFREKHLSHQHFPVEYHDLILAQGAIGWDQMLRGKIARQWQTNQSSYWRRRSHHPKPSETKWPSKMIRVLLTQAHAIWCVRCKARHGHDSKSQIQATTRQLHRTVRFLYEYKDQVQEEDRAIFRDDLETHLLASNRELHNWVAINKPLIRHSCKAATKAALLDTPHTLPYYFPTPQTNPRRRRRRTAKPRRPASPSQTFTDTYLSRYFPTQHRRQQNPYSRRAPPSPDNSYDPPQPMFQRHLTDFWPDHPT